MMQKLSLFLLIALLSFASCSTTAQTENKSATQNTTPKAEVQMGIVNLDVANFKDKMSDKDAVILDVRTTRETAQSMISGAIEIDVTQPTFKEKIQELDKDKTYLVYCRSGRRSVAACEIMEKEGFGKLNNLLGGLIEWKKSKKVKIQF